MSGRRTWPAVAMLLDSGEPGFEALIAPGHVATVMGPEEWEFVPRDHGIADRGGRVRAGLAAGGALFRAAAEARGQVLPRQLLSAGRASRRQRRGAAPSWTRRWTSSTATGAASAPIPQSGYVLKPRLRGDTIHACSCRRTPRWPRKRAGEMPPGCDCAKVVLGKIYPNECRLYGLACTPRQPVGPCMVSDEGACRIWWANGVRENVWAGRKASGADGRVSEAPAGRIARRLVMTGRVQGVGFRPFVYRLAHEHAARRPRAQPARRRRGRGLRSRLRASTAFARDIVERAPPLARPAIARDRPAATPPAEAASTLPRAARRLRPQVSVPPDFFACDDCLRELARSRRPPPSLPVHQLHAVRTTLHADRGAAVRPAEHQHGALPAVRRRAGANTRIRSIAASTRSRSPARCAGRTSGSLEPAGTRRMATRRHSPRRSRYCARAGCSRSRGIGGYHLVCDARSETAVQRLRERKRRPHKPLAVMFPQAGADGLDALRAELDPDGAECAALLDPARPIVLAPATRGFRSRAFRCAGPRRSRSLPALQPAAPPAARCVRRARGRHLRQRERRARPHGSRGGRSAARHGRRCFPAPRPARSSGRPTIR